MKIKYDSVWTRIYKFSTGRANDTVTDDFFNYWFTVGIGVLLLPITSISIIVEKVVPESVWNIWYRLFVGLVIWSFLGCFGVIAWSVNKAGYIVIVWTILMYLAVLIILFYLVFIKFSSVGNHIIHIIYIIVSWIGKLYSKMSIKPKLELDRQSIYIIIDIIRYDDLERLILMDEIDMYTYNELSNSTYAFITADKKVNLTKFLNEDYLVYEAVQYGTEIIKGNRL
jgi:hypothetical protein